jgi:hypothetical protein
MRAGDFFYIPPGHDSWVVGDDPYVSLHLMGTDRYAIKADRELTVIEERIERRTNA